MKTSIITASILAITFIGNAEEASKGAWKVIDANKKSVPITTVAEFGSAGLKILNERIRQDGQKITGTIWRRETIGDNKFTKSSIIIVDLLPVRGKVVETISEDQIPRLKANFEQALKRLEADKAPLAKIGEGTIQNGVITGTFNLDIGQGLKLNPSDVQPKTENPAKLPDKALEKAPEKKAGQ